MFIWRTIGRTGKETGFERVPEEDPETLHAAIQHSPVNARRPRIAHNGIPWLTVALIVTVTAVVSATLGAWAAQQSRIDADAFSIRHTSHDCKYGTA